jgi:hypothetical protein
MAKRVEGQVAVHGHVNREDKGREIDEEAQLLHAKETTAPLGDVGV